MAECSYQIYGLIMKEIDWYENDATIIDKGVRKERVAWTRQWIATTGKQIYDELLEIAKLISTRPCKKK